MQQHSADKKIDESMDARDRTELEMTTEQARSYNDDAPVGPLLQPENSTALVDGVCHDMDNPLSGEALATLRLSLEEGIDRYWPRAPVPKSVTRFQPGAQPIPDLSGPRGILDGHAARLEDELRKCLGDRLELRQQERLLRELHAYRRAADVLAGFFTVDGEELVDSSSRAPEFLGQREDK